MSLTGSAALPGGETLRAFAAAARAGVVVVDDAGTILLCNPAAEALLNRTGEELTGAELGFPLVPNGTSEIEVVADGGVRTVEMQVTATSWDRRRAHVVALTDASPQRRFARRLADSEERFRAVFEQTPIGLALLGDGLRIVRANRALCEMSGYAPEELEHGTLDEILATGPLAAEAELARGLASGHATGYDVTGGFLTKAGETRWARFITSVMSGSADDGPRVILSVEDITERTLASERMTRLALRDGLTGLANRTLAMDRLHQAQARAERSGTFVALLFLDLDRFKAINDSLGHAMGDAYLVETARRLRSVLRPSDTVARLGGDEFVICCEELGAEAGEARAEALHVVERIVAALAEPVELEGAAERMTASIGIALVSGLERHPDIVLRNADQAMYRAKQQGGARFEFFDEALQVRTASRNELAEQLSLALRRDELLLHYQPITDLSDGRIVAAEALVRWDHPGRGILLPSDFLDVAEEGELIVAIGDWVLKRACQDLAAWRRDVSPQLVVMVNASARQLERRALAASVDVALTGSGLTPEALQIELTETVLIASTDSTLSELEGLRELGVQVGLDDFGTGYASLTYLRRLPLDFVKVDGSFVAGLGGKDDDAIVTAIVDLAHGLGLRVVAEGVESSQQRRALEAIGCRYAQGWHVGRPQASGDFTRLLESQALA